MKKQQVSGRKFISGSVNIGLGYSLTMSAGSILGLCNSPVFVGDEMWMYYTAMTTTHGGYLPDKEMSVARASWRIDGVVSMRSGESEGLIEFL